MRIFHTSILTCICLFSARLVDAAKQDVNLKLLPKTTRFCIIGGGPSGVTAAATLKQAGYTHVTVLEKAAQLGGHCFTTSRGMDLGVTFYNQFYPYTLKKLFKQLNVKTPWLIHRNMYYSLAAGKQIRRTTLKQKIQLIFEMLRYTYLHTFRWHGVRELQASTTSPQLHEPWIDFAKHHGFMQMEITLRGFFRSNGYHPKTPTLYIARVARPHALWRYVLQPKRILGFFEKGSQNIVKQLVELYKINFHTQISLKHIQRQQEVTIDWLDKDGQSQQTVCDYLIMACNPKYLLHALDASPEESALFNQLTTRPYYVYEAAVDNILPGMFGCITFTENLDAYKVDHPMQLYKRYPNNNLCAIYVPASHEQTPEQRLKNLNHDITCLGGKLVKVWTCKFWPAHSPMVDQSALDAGFFQRLYHLQGANRTIGVGRIYTVDLITHVITHAQCTINELLAQRLPGQQVEPNK